VTSKQFDRLLRLFNAWSLEEFGHRPYGYQVRIDLTPEGLQQETPQQGFTPRGPR
jgi:hypothetical protein